MILISISQSMRTKFLDITHVVNEKSFVLLGVFKDVKIAVAGSTRSVHPSDADTLNNVRRNDSKYEGKNFVEIQSANVARNLQIESNYHNRIKRILHFAFYTICYSLIDAIKNLGMCKLFMHLDSSRHRCYCTSWL